MKRSAFEIIGAPFDLGAPRRGGATAPAVLRERSLPGRLRVLEEETGISVVDGGDVAAPPAGEERAAPRHLPECLSFCRDLMRRLGATWAAGRVPVVLGGDHSVSIGVVSAAARHLREGDGDQAELGLLWIDAHADLESLSAKPEEDLHATAAAHLIGHGADELCDLAGFRPAVRPENVIFLGLRDVYRNERRLLRETNSIVYTSRDVERKGIERVCEQVFATLAERVDAFAVSFDVDALDPLPAPGVVWPAPGGLTFREADVLMEHVARSEGLLSLDFMEYFPPADQDHATAGLVIELIRTALGGTIF